MLFDVIKLNALPSITTCGVKSSARERTKVLPEPSETVACH